MRRKAGMYSACLGLALALLSTVMGCTLYPQKTPATLQSTTSSEHFERTFWQDVKAKNQNELNVLLADNLVYTHASGTATNKAQTVAALTGQEISDYSLGEIVLKPNGPDMVLNYVANVTDQGGQHQWRITSVWQQTKASGWTMIAHTETICTTGSATC